MLLEVWINAFIPKEVPNYTKRITKGKHSGKTAVPLPGVARLHPFNSIKNWNTGYLTDQRSFKNSPTESVRMQSFATIEIGSQIKLDESKSRHHSSGTTEVDIKEGRTLASAVANMNRCRFSLSPVPEIRCLYTREILLNSRKSLFGEIDGLASDAGSLLDYVLYVVGAASDPLVWAAADINYAGKFEVSKGRNNTLRVSFSGCIDNFPAFECYARSGGKTKPLFTASPPLGNTVVSLIGGANRPVSGVVSFP